MGIVVPEEVQGLKVWKVLDGPRGDSAEKKVRKSLRRPFSWHVK